MATDRLCLCINVRNNAPSQYANYNFNSFALVNGLQVGVNEDGIYTLDDAENDHGSEIYAFFETVTTDFGIKNAKRMRKGYVGYEASGNLILKVKADDEIERTYLLKPVKKGQLQHKAIVPLGRDLKGTYFMYRLENKDGCDFSLDSLEVLPVILSMGR